MVMIKVILWALVGLSQVWAWSMPEYNMTRGVTPVSHEIYEIHMVVFYICLCILIGVSAVMIYSLIKFRHSKGAIPSKNKGNVLVEIIWTLIPCLLLIGIAVPSTKTLMKIVDTEDPDMNIKVIGRQWNWKYEYLDEGIEFSVTYQRP